MLPRGSKATTYFPAGLSPKIGWSCSSEAMMQTLWEELRLLMKTSSQRTSSFCWSSPVLFLSPVILGLFTYSYQRKFYLRARRCWLGRPSSPWWRCTCKPVGWRSSIRWNLLRLLCAGSTGRSNVGLKLSSRWSFPFRSKFKKKD